MDCMFSSKKNVFRINSVDLNPVTSIVHFYGTISRLSDVWKPQVTFIQPSSGLYSTFDQSESTFPASNSSGHTRRSRVGRSRCKRRLYDTRPRRNIFDFLPKTCAPRPSRFTPSYVRPSRKPSAAEHASTSVNDVIFYYANGAIFILHARDAFRMIYSVVK